MAKHNSDERFLLLFFECDNTYSVVDSRSKGCKNITATTAEILHNNEWYTGVIRYAGSEKKCERKVEKYLEKMRFTSTDDEEVQQKKNQGVKRKIIISKSTSSEEVFERFSNEMSKVTRTINEIEEIESEELSHIQEHARVINNSTNQANEYNSDVSIVDGVVLINILTEINNKVTLMSEEILFLKDQIGLIKKRDKNEPTWLTEVIYNGIDLMKYSESQMNKYVTKLMELVYTPEEMKNGLIIEGEKSNSKRERLDLNKFNLIKIATINKFKLINEVKAAAEIREIACRKCRDMSKKKQLTESS